MPAKALTHTPELQELISIQQAAREKSVHPDTLRRRIASGELKAYRLGARIIRVDRAEVDALLHPVPSVDRGRAAS
jgi:excisionase family DNA binding protein